MLTLVNVLSTFNSFVLKIGRGFGAVAIGLMVVVILLQVFFRYVLNSALPWPDEAARFLMLWMTALIAPSAYRAGGFVAIDTINVLLSEKVGRILSLALLLISLVVLIVAFQLSQKHVNSGWLFASSTLKIPLHLIGMEAVKVKLAWMYMSIAVGIVLLISVNVELVLKNLLVLINPSAQEQLAEAPAPSAGAQAPSAEGQEATSTNKPAGE